MDTIDYGKIVPPGMLNRARELGWIFHMARLPLAYIRPHRRELPAHQIILLPGYGGGDLSLRPLELYLRRCGFNVRTWGLGRNNGDMSELFPRVRDQVKSEYETQGRPVILLGWSLGGVLAREVTRDHPEWVDEVVTLGTPIIGGPKFTIFRRLYSLTGRNIERIERNIKTRYRKPIRRPVTALYSKTDGVVAWEACIDRWSLDVRHHQVACSHMAMGFSGPVFIKLQQLLGDIVEKRAQEAA